MISAVVFEHIGVLLDPLVDGLALFILGLLVNLENDLRMLGRNGQQRGRVPFCPAMQIGKDILINMGFEAGDD